MTNRSQDFPVIVRDPRFQAGRKLIGQAPSVEVFATLLGEARRIYGEDHLEAAPAYYEYGNAIFRVAQRKLDDEGPAGTAIEKNIVRNAAAEAAERRAIAASANGDVNETAAMAATKTEGNRKDDEKTDEESSKDDEDILLALEMMETAWSILDRETISSSASSAVSYPDYIKEQVPRTLTGIGDVFSALNRHADAADAYLRALEHRQNTLEQNLSNSAMLESLAQLECRRKVVEANILIAEELLACPRDQDVVTTEANAVLVTSGEIVEYARGYYDKARDELQEVVVLLGQLAANNVEVDDEKENICFAATLVMGTGETFAAIDEEVDGKETTEDERFKKKTKT
jgi:tetratricopeptide (TPR) repeat protein